MSSETQPPATPARWNGFVHLAPWRYMNYHAAVMRAAQRAGRRRAVDIDVQLSADGTMWALHWPRVGKNHLHDPRGQIKPHAFIADLHDEEIARLRGPDGRAAPLRIVLLLTMAANHRVRVELELKTYVPADTLKALLLYKRIKRANAAGLIQVKTLVKIAGAVERLRAAHEAGFTTILCFSFYKGHAVSKTAAWPVTNFVRGRRVVWR